jgi:hypothetical protein
VSRKANARLAGVAPGRWYVWLPLAAYEIPVAPWLLVKAAAAPARSAAPA